MVVEVVSNCQEIDGQGHNQFIEKWEECLTVGVGEPTSDMKLILCFK